MLLEKEVQTNVKQLSDMGEQSVSCFVILNDNPAFNLNTKSYNIEICGKPMVSWVARACPTPPAYLEQNANESIIETIRPYLKNTDYTLVLYSDTPLMTKSNIDSIMDFVINRGLSVCKLTRGYVFKTEYIKRVGEIYAPQTYYFEEEDFMIASSFHQVSIIADILRNRILSFHMKNGVYFKDPSSAFIGGDVSIGKGTIIEPQVWLSGKVVIGEDCKIGSGSKLENVCIFNNCIIGSAAVKSSVIEEGVTIGENVVVEKNSLVKKDSVIKNNVVISSSIVNENTTIKNGMIIAPKKSGDLL